MKHLCQPCADEYASWYHYRPHYRAEYTLTDNPHDLARINHDRWRETVNAQHRMIAVHCKENHAESA